MALTAKRTAAAGGADATQTTAAGVYGVVESLLTTAGWTLHFDYIANVSGAWIPSTVLPPFTASYGTGQIVTNAGNVYQCIQGGNASTNPTGPTGEAQSIGEGTCVWRFITSSAGSAKVFTSNGESGGESLFVRLDCNTNTTPSINVHTYQYFASPFGQNRFSSNLNSVHQFTYTAGNTVNYAMVADKDNFQVFTNDNVNNRRIFGGGRLKRAPGVIGTSFVSNNAVTAGANKTFTFSSGDPVAAGYKVDDHVFVVAQQAGTIVTPVQNIVIPIYAAVITAVTTNSITIDFAQEATSAGALIGADPQNQFVWTTSSNFDTSSANALFCAYQWNNTVPNIWSAGNNDSGFPNLGGGRNLIETGPLSLDPNNRTGRVVIGEILFMQNINSAAGVAEVSGIIPKLFSNPRLTDALWSIGRTVKETSNFDYVTFPANTASPTSQIRSEIGPFTISGGSTYSADLYSYDLLNTWIEAEVPETIWPQADKTAPTYMRGMDIWPFIGTVDLNDETNEVLAAVVTTIEKENQASDKVGQISTITPSGELTPFDSATATAGGNEGGFNGGFN